MGSNKINIIKTLDKAQTKYDGAIGLAERSIFDKVKFNFGIIYQPSDGFCLLDIKNNFLASLDTCLEYIDKHGYLTYDDFKRFTI